MKKPIKVVMLPTKDESPIGYHFDIDKKGSIDYAPNFGFDLFDIKKNYQHKPQHIYITVSQDVEPIKKGDWFFNSQINRVILAKVDETIATSRKIIATDDPKLICPTCTRCNGTGNRSSNEPILGNCLVCGGRGILLNKIPQVQQSFLKEFVANPDRKWEVEYESKYEYGRYLHNKPGYVYVTKLKLNQDNTVNITSVKEKMYSREEVEILIKRAFSDFRQKSKSVQYIVGGGNPNSNGTKRKYIVTDVYKWIKDNL